jgi:hypothetical protein
MEGLGSDARIKAWTMADKLKGKTLLWLSILLRFSEQNAAFFRCHFALGYTSENSLDEGPRFVRFPFALMHNNFHSRKSTQGSNHSIAGFARGKSLPLNKLGR